MKKIFIILASAALALGACSDKDDDNENNGGGNGNGNGNGGGNGGGTELFTVEVKASDIIFVGDKPQLDEVRLIHYTGGKELTLATAEYNDGFKLTFPESIPTNQLVKFEFEDDEDEEGTVELSKEGVLVTDFESIYIAGYNDGEYVDYFEYGYFDRDTEDFVDFMYSNDDVTAKGVIIYSEEWGTEKTTYNMDLKKGWNQVAYIGNEVSEDYYEDQVTTTIPSNFKWYFETYESEVDRASAKSKAPHFFGRK